MVSSRDPEHADHVQREAEHKGPPANARPECGETSDVNAQKGQARYPINYNMTNIGLSIHSDMLCDISFEGCQIRATDARQRGGGTPSGPRVGGCLECSASRSPVGRSPRST